MGFSMELSSEVPGTNAGWPSDISSWVNDKKLGTWRCRRDYGDRDSKYTPLWWNLAGSQYGILTTWRIRPRGRFLGAEKLSGVNIRDLSLARHHSIRLKIGIDERGSPPGGREHIQAWIWQSYPKTCACDCTLLKTTPGRDCTIWVAA
jgi:predicted transcriptional regulator